VAELTHIDGRGKAKMVDVSAKDATCREAVARGEVKMDVETLRRILRHQIAKGEVLAVARVAGIMAAKETARLIPLCHPLNLTAVEVSFHPREEEGRLEIEGRARVAGQTGVEMEALTAVSVAALTVYDMCKAVDKHMVIGAIRLVSKSGGRSGVFQREGEETWADVW